MDDQFADAAPNGRGLLYAMTTETVREVKIRDARRQPDERVVIEHVHIVMAGPSTTRLESLKGRHTRGKHGPNVFVKKRIVDLEIVTVGVCISWRRYAAEKALTFRSNINASRVDQQWAAANLLITLECKNHALFVVDRYFETGCPCDRWSAGTSSVDDDAARNACPVVQQYRRDTIARPLDAGGRGRRSTAAVFTLCLSKTQTRRYWCGAAIAPSPIFPA
jgi:hypothetical protein